MKIEEIISKELSNQEIKSLWYDWFCSDEALINRGKKLISRLKSIVKANKRWENIGNFEVSFKNCCPVNGMLYDTILLHNNDSDDFIQVTPCIGHYNKDFFKKSEVWVDDKQQIIGAWKEVLNWFKQQ